MTTRTPSTIVVRYDAERKMVICNVVDETKIEPLIQGKLDIPVVLEDFDDRVDDEFARRFGAAVLSVLAEYKPDLKPYLDLTPAPKDD